jgi:PAS domain S-box-containing protein
VAGRVEPAIEASDGAQARSALTTVDVLPILLVDDRADNLDALKAVLGPLGIPLHSAASGDEALRQVLKRDFALILLDVRMPGLDGLETARLIKSRERTRDVPIVFLTAERDEVRDIIRGYGIGAIDYVLKPFDAELLRSKVAVFAELEAGRRALKRSEGFLRAAFDAAPIGKTILDGGGRIVRSNRAFAHLVGYETDALIGTAVTELCHPEDVSALADVLGQATERGSSPTGEPAPVTVDLRIERRGGGQVWVALVASTIEPAESAESLLLAQWVDLSERLRSEQARQQLLLEQAAREHAETVAKRLDELHEREHQIAVELQRGLLPKVLPELPGLEIATHYEAAGASAQVGGDWYDAFALPGGRVGIVVGDVAGRGIPAASAMGQLRSVTRAYALADDGYRHPGEVLTLLNRHQITLGADELFTVIYAIIDPGKETLHWANAGHPGPILRKPDGATRHLQDGEGLVGFDDTVYVDRCETLHAGETVVLFTDGLIERRGESLDDGIERLERLVAAGPERPEPLCEHVLDGLFDDGQNLQDDVTAVIVRVS